MLRTLYQPLIDTVFTLMWPKLKNKYTEGYDERCGDIPASKIAKLGGRRPLWLHGVSVGEMQAAVPLAKAARASGYDGPIVISTTTETGKEMACLLGDGLFDFHVYYPWDKKKFVHDAVDSLDPWAFAAAETELWPNMLWTLRDRHIPRFLLNGRISDRTNVRMKGPLRHFVARRLFDLFTELYLREEKDAQRLRKIGLDPAKLFVLGDNKIDALLARKKQEDLAALRSRIEVADEPVFIAGSTHEGEDEIVRDAFLLVKEQVPEAKLILAPRHPERIPNLVSLFAGLRETLFSAVSSPWDVLMVDEIGVLFALYGLTRAAFVGGSFVNKGGQNILEPACWGVPVQYGPHIEDFAAQAETLEAMGLAGKVANAQELAAVWIGYINSGDVKETFSDRVEQYFTSGAGAAKHAWQRIARYIPEHDGGADEPA